MKGFKLKKLPKPKVKRKAALRLQEHFGLSVSRSCRIVELNRSSYNYKPLRINNDANVISRMKELIASHKSWGYPIIHEVLKREGLVKNPKRTWRIYKENNLTLKQRKRPKRASIMRLKLVEPTRPNERWAMDVDTSINGDRVTRVLDWLVLIKGTPKFITTDNGPEFSGKALDKWTYNNNVTLDFIEPGKPIQNAFIESFNGRLRHECLNKHYFLTLQEAKKIVENWRVEYNTFRPHGFLKGLTQEEFTKNWNKEKHQKTPDSQLTACTA